MELHQYVGVGVSVLLATVPAAFVVCWKLATLTANLAAATRSLEEVKGNIAILFAREERRHCERHDVTIGQLDRRVTDVEKTLRHPEA